MEGHIHPLKEKKIGQMNDVERSKTTYDWRFKRFDLEFLRDNTDLRINRKVLKKNLVSETFVAGEDVGLESLWHIELSNNRDVSYSGSVASEIHFIKARIVFEKMVGYPDGAAARWTPFTCQANMLHPELPQPSNLNFDSDEEPIQIKRNGQGVVIFIRLEEVAERIYDKAVCFSAEIEIFGKEFIVPIGSPLGSTEKFGHILLQNDLGELLNSKESSDFIIKCDGKNFQVHKLILAARSKVFAAMFAGDYKECKTNEMVVDDIDQITMEILLEYIYTGKRSELVDSDNLVTIVRGADKYDLAELKNYYFNQVLLNITEDNYGELVLLAGVIRPGENEMKVLKNYYEKNVLKLMKNPEFRKLAVQHPEVVFEK